MECVGPSLHDLLRQRGPASPPLPEATVRAAMWQLLTAAKKMHGGGIAHRDIKPQNILVGDGRSVVKLCDFGLAKSTDERPPYEPAGTLWYMAPDMLLEKPDYDERVDVWSLGCVMAELINNGRPLLQGFYDQGQLCAIFDVLGVPDDSTWPGGSRPRRSPP
jgi:serine/threonine protein kinase